MYSISAFIARDIPEKVIEEMHEMGFSTKTNKSGYSLITISEASYNFIDSEFINLVFNNFVFTEREKISGVFIRHTLMDILRKCGIKILVSVKEDSDNCPLENRCTVFELITEKHWTERNGSGSLRDKLRTAFEMENPALDPFYTVGLGSVRTNRDITTPELSDKISKAKEVIDTRKFEAFKCEFEKKTEAERAQVIAKVFKPTSLYDYSAHSDLPSTCQLERYYGVEF